MTVATSQTALPLRTWICQRKRVCFVLCLVCSIYSRGLAVLSQVSGSRERDAEHKTQCVALRALELCLGRSREWDSGEDKEPPFVTSEKRVRGYRDLEKRCTRQPEWRSMSYDLDTKS